MVYALNKTKIVYINVFCEIYFLTRYFAYGRQGIFSTNIKIISNLGISNHVIVKLKTN